MKSLRNHLILLLSVGLGAAWVVSAWLGHSEARYEVDELFDAQMAQSAQAILDASRHNIDERLERGDRDSHDDSLLLRHQYEQKLLFQVWSTDGNVLQRSRHAPEKMMADPVQGYQTVNFDHQTWRVLTRLDSSGKFLVQVAEPLDKREWLARHIAFKILLPTLLVLPLLVLLIWWFVGKGLRPLGDIGRQVQARAATRLDALQMDDVPDEVVPLVAALNDLFERLQRAFEGELRFTADAAHELRTPLAALKVQAQVALRATCDAERNAALENVLQGVDRATHLITQLLTLARVDPDSAATGHVRLNLYSLAAVVVEQYRAMAASKDIHLTLAGSDAEVLGDASQLEVLIRNVLDNALRYTPQGGAVDVSVNQSEEVILEVSDNGSGIPVAQRERVLERFYRIPGNGQTGSGLGLSIVKRVAERHRARISLDSSARGGLLVRVILASVETSHT